MYKFCFHNSYSTSETVSFYIHVGHIPTEHDLAKDDHLNPLNVKIAELSEALESVTAEQRYLKARDARHRYTNESTRVDSPSTPLWSTSSLYAQACFKQYTFVVF